MHSNLLLLSKKFFFSLDFLLLLLYRCFISLLLLLWILNYRFGCMLPESNIDLRNLTNKKNKELSSHAHILCALNQMLFADWCEFLHVWPSYIRTCLRKKKKLNGKKKTKMKKQQRICALHSRHTNNKIIDHTRFFQRNITPFRNNKFSRRSFVSSPLEMIFFFLLDTNTGTQRETHQLTENVTRSISVKHVLVCYISITFS